MMPFYLLFFNCYETFWSFKPKQNETKLTILVCDAGAFDKIIIFSGHLQICIKCYWNWMIPGDQMLQVVIGSSSGGTRNNATCTKVSMIYDRTIHAQVF